MRFRVTRTTERYNEQPCPEATRGPDGAWYVELATLDDLVRFYERHGRLVIDDGSGEDALSIEIYDDWRE